MSRFFSGLGRITMVTGVIVALVTVVVLRNESASAAVGEVIVATGQLVAAPPVDSRYISSGVGRALVTSTPDWDPAALDEIRQLTTETGSRALLLFRGDELVFEYVPEGRGPFPVASISKAIKALAVARLVDEGKISFDDHLADTILAWRDDARRDVKVRDLLSHTSGLSSSLESMVGPPGGIPSYHLGAYDVVSGVVAAKAGIPFVQFVDEHLLKPAGGQGLVWSRLHDGEASGASATVDDLAVLGQLVRRGGFAIGGEVLRARTLDEVTRPHGQIARGFGMGWFLHYPTDNALQYDIVEARGGSGHMVTIVPSQQALLVRIQSRGGDAGVPERFHALLRRL
jgi:CubicO group peptidase (beta-lactamase class C family)